MDVLVTRPAEAGRRTADKLYARGHRAILAPLLWLREVAGSAPPGDFDVIAVTSASVAIATQRLHQFHDIPVFTVGEQTAATLRGMGFESVISSDGDVADLAGLMIAALQPHSRVLYVTGRDRKNDLEATLTLAGHRVSPWVVYAAEAVMDLPPGLTRRLETGQVDAILHYSTRTARIFANLSRKLQLLRGIATTPQICISTDVAGPLREAGLTRIGVAASPDEAAMLEELERYRD